MPGWQSAAAAGGLQARGWRGCFCLKAVPASRMFLPQGTDSRALPDTVLRRAHLHVATQHHHRLAQRARWADTLPRRGVLEPRRRAARHVQLMQQLRARVDEVSDRLDLAPTTTPPSSPPPPRAFAAKPPRAVAAKPLLPAAPGHVTSASIGHVTSASTGHVTSASTGHVTSASIGHVTSASIGHVTSASIGHVTSASIGHQLPLVRLCLQRRLAFLQQSHQALHVATQPVRVLPKRRHLGLQASARADQLLLRRPEAARRGKGRGREKAGRRVGWLWEALQLARAEQAGCAGRWRENG
eukprot:361719-Chlamydomonas_euryale.AAC.1